MSENCLFTKIINKDIPAEIVYENEQVLAFKDINPQASIHVLFIHKQKTENVIEMIEKPKQIQDIFSAIKEYATQEGLEGFRVVNNCGSLGGQTIFYTHFHLLAGGQLSGSFNS